METKRGSAFMLFLLLFYLGFLLLMWGIVIPALGDDARQIISSPWFLIFQQLAVLVLPLLIWTIIRKEKLKFQSQPLGKTNLIMIIFLSFFFQPLMMFISGLSSFIMPNPVANMLDTMVVHPLWLLILAIAVTPAICEELVFRGYIQDSHKHLTVKKSALINGLFFAIIHLNLHQFFYAFAMGIVFFIMVYYTRSILAGIISHFIINASQVSLGNAASRMIDSFADYTAVEAVYDIEISESLELLMAIGVLGFIALIATPCALVVLKSFIKHNKNRNAEIDGLNDEILTLAQNETEIEYTVVENEIEVKTNETENKGFRKRVDPYFIAVIALFLLIIFLL